MALTVVTEPKKCVCNRWREIGPGTYLRLGITADEKSPSHLGFDDRVHSINDQCLEGGCRLQDGTTR